MPFEDHQEYSGVTVCQIIQAVTVSMKRGSRQFIASLSFGLYLLSLNQWMNVMIESECG